MLVASFTKNLDIPGSLGYIEFVAGYSGATVTLSSV
nr:MAG TPA: hypothetical protein [Caudoviricetes sp.]DAH18922.1 MAG TPA: hypothetical protein [Caudoviricetes sp.]